ncbi:MAG TPA: hypothetical protein VGJ26_09310 [Pirellulales bacterium]|jgi:hypothetical protein
MAKQGKQRTANPKRGAPAPAEPPANPLTSLPADPPRRHLWFLVAASIGVAAWMLFLLIMSRFG